MFGIICARPRTAIPSFVLLLNYDANFFTGILIKKIEPFRLKRKQHLRLGTSRQQIWYRQKPAELPQ